MNGEDDASDPRESDPQSAQDADPTTGTSDDPRVDPTRERRHGDPDDATREL